MRRDVVSITGVGVFRGDVDADLVKCQGVGKADGVMTCRKLDVQGLFTAANRIRAEEAEIMGLLKSKSDFSAERINVKGALVIDGILNTGSLDIQFERFGRIKEVRAHSLNIRPLLHPIKNRGAQFLDNLLNTFTGQSFRMDVVEANEIYLENVQANVVRGENVIIGPNCTIGYLEYSKKARVHDSAKVDNMKGTRPSAG